MEEFSNLIKNGAEYFWDQFLEQVRSEFERRVDEEVSNRLTDPYIQAVSLHEQLTSRTVAALYEANVDEDIIIQMMQKHCGLRQKDAERLLREEKVVQKPYRDIQHYLQREGYDWEEITEFMRKNKVYEKLRENNKLWKENIENLITIVQE